MAERETIKLKIAVAEDEPDVRMLLVRILECLGHEVMCAAENGADLVNQCVALDVDLALLDLDMPKMDGLAAAEVLASKGIPAILISGHPDAEHVVVEHEPVVTRLRKPASVESLQAAIDEALAARRKSGAASHKQ